MRVLKAVRPSPATVIASIALLVALAGTGYAATSLPKNSVGPDQLQANAVTSSKVKNHSLLKVDFATNQLQRGAPGAPGPPGANGAPGTPGARGTTGPPGAAAAGVWAVVNADGTIARGSGVIGVAHVAASGAYDVTFNRTISQCAWLATISQSTFGFINTALGSSTAVHVETLNPSTAPTDRAFHLAVVC